MNNVHEEVATRNAQAAIERIDRVEKIVDERLKSMEALVNNLSFKAGDLERKYNLLLTKNFSGGSTTDGDKR